MVCKDTRDRQCLAWQLYLTLPLPSVHSASNNMMWKSLSTSIRSTVLRVSGRSLCVSATGRAAAAQQLDLRGVYPPMPTPFLKDETIAYDKLASNVGVWSTMPFRGKWGVHETSDETFIFQSCVSTAKLHLQYSDFFFFLFF